MEDNLKVINDYRYVCRACLTDEGEFQSVFVSDENSGLTIHLAEMIMAYTSIQITLGDGLPEQICIPCAKKVVLLYLFKQQCEESDATLREQLTKPVHKMCSVTEEQRLAAEALHIDPYLLDVVIKPEISAENDETVASEGVHSVNLDDNYDVSFSSDHGSGIDDVIESKSNQISCDICCKLFTRISHLNRHKKVHAAYKEYVSDVCHKGYSKNDLLVRHRAAHEIKEESISLIHSKLENEVSDEIVVEEKFSDLDLKWVPSEKQFLTKEEFLAYTAVPHIDDKSELCLKCDICNKKFTKTSHYNRHLKIHSKIKGYVCKLCGKGFARSEQLANHMNAHSGIKPHVCKICNKGFNQVSNLKDHMRTHNGEKPFLCSTCGKGFNQLGNLRQHTIRHSGVKAHLCSTCGNGFASKGELCAHLRKHTGARPFVCPICNHGFTTSSSLTKHKRIHSGEKPYECEVCKMKFSRSGILARHKRTHTGEKPYVCKYCTKAFSQSNDLSSHLRIHTGEKPYICDTCGNSFRQSSALKTHKKTHVDKTQILDHTRNIVPLVRNTFINTIP